MTLTGSSHADSQTGGFRRILAAERLGIVYARIALGAAFLSAVADRFGLWGKYGGWGNFANFEKYTAQVNSFIPASMIPFLAWVATVAELAFGIALILGIWTRWVARGAAALLFLFGTAMAFPLASSLRWITRSSPLPRGRSCFPSTRQNETMDNGGRTRGMAQCSP
ncbi:MAG TPA: DoxX family protein [Candidatus Sulfotelmatobacter sp.]|nr:DoxX family protein [Candidatus Sulfotelmatobacter sp.]